MLMIFKIIMAFLNKVDHRVEFHNPEHFSSSFFMNYYTFPRFYQLYIYSNIYYHLAMYASKQGAIKKTNK
jgi:hypothetical protein